MIDIFKSDFQLPSQVYIVAPGWRGVDHYYKIPDDAYIIALNKAVLIPTVHTVPWKFAVHLVTDVNAPRQEWWFSAMQQDVTRIFSRVSKVECDYTFEHDPLVTVPVPGSLCGGSTVLGTALQLCYWFMQERLCTYCFACIGSDHEIDKSCAGCAGTGRCLNKIHLLGADMGTTDFTGLVTYKPGHFKYAQQEIGRWIHFVKEKGIEVECLSISPLEEYCE